MTAEPAPLTSARVQVLADAQQVARAAADLIAAAASARPDLVLALPTGRTLADRAAAGAILGSQV